MSAFYLLPDEPAKPETCRKKALYGQKPPLKPREVWAIRTRLQIQGKRRDLALFNLAIDSKLRSCDLVRLRVRDVAHGEHVVSRASVMQQKTGQPVRFEFTEQTREAVQAWIAIKRLSAGDYLFPSRHRQSPHISTRQSARIVTTAGFPHWPRSGRLRHPLPAPLEGDADLPPDQESPGSAALARAHKAGLFPVPEYVPLSSERLSWLAGV